jgi:hypothetical protein
MQIKRVLRWLLEIGYRPAYDRKISGLYLRPRHRFIEACGQLNERKTLS